jgi:acyl carrier protein
MPVTSSGKIDKKALPDPDVKELFGNKYIAPRNELEERLALIWKEILNIEQVGVYDNFFELGGHSLLAMRVISSIIKEMEIELTIKDLFKFTNINDLSKYLEIQTSIYSEEKDPTEFEQIII